MLLSGAHIDHWPTLLHELAEFLRTNNVAVPTQHVLSHVAEEVDGILGRGEGRGVGQFEISKLISGNAAGHRRGNHIDSLVNTVPPNDLSPEDCAITRVEDELRSHASRSWVVGRVVEGVGVDCPEGAPSSLQSAFVP